jgi:formylglycine-generating enzyme required for sulfatase activity
MNRSRPASLALASLVVLSCVAAPLRCAAQEAKPAAAVNPPKPAAKAGGTTDEPKTAPRDPAGMVRFKGGKVRIGIDRKDLMEYIKDTDLGRMANAQIGIENEYSLSTPEHEVTLPSYWIGMYEVTNAQWHRFLEIAAKETYVVPKEGQGGPRTLEEISRAYLIAERFTKVGGGFFFPVAVSWRGLYDLNEEAVNPSVDGAGKPLDPASRPKPDSFQNVPLRPGTKLTVYRWTVPTGWSVDGKLRASPPAGRESQPVTGISLCDAEAFSEYFGRHVPTEDEWEAAARGPKGEIHPEGKWNPLGHAWKFFNPELEKAKEQAKKDIASAKKRLEEAEKGGSAASVAAARTAVETLSWILAAKDLPDFPNLATPPVVEVGMFPLGRSPCGAFDMLGNAEEWVSTPLTPYPGTDSKSTWIGVRAHVLRGGNTYDLEALICGVFRKFLAEAKPIHKTYRANSHGFRVARYEVPGASAAVRAVMKIRAIEPPVLPRETDPKTHVETGPDLDLYGAVGIERLEEAMWDASLAPQSDPAGKVFFNGPSRNLCVVPATGTPFKDPGAIRKAADAAEPPDPDAVKKSADKRQPRDVPFFGMLHVSDGMEVKGTVRTVVVEKVPLTPEEKAAWIAEWKARKKAEEDAKKDDGSGKDNGKGDDKDDGSGKKDDGGSKPPDNKMVPGDDKGKKGDKDGKGKKGDKGGKGDKPAEEPKKDGEAPAPAADGEGGDEEEETMVVPTEKEVRKTVMKPGFLRGKDYPNGLLLGFQRHGTGLRAVLWEARPGVVGSTATGGVVLLEQPLIVLGEGDMDFKRVNKEMSPWSILDETSGEVKLVFYVPVEDGKGAAIETTLKLHLGEFPSGTPEAPWRVQAIR